MDPVKMNQTDWYLYRKRCWPHALPDHRPQCAGATPIPRVALGAFTRARPLF